jgi:hypothetical protein
MIRNDKLCLVLGLASLALLAASGTATRADDVLDIKEATLETSGIDPDAQGTAQFARAGDQVKLGVEVDGVFSTNLVIVVIRGHEIAPIKLSAGRGEIELQSASRKGQRVINAGDVIDVIDAFDGAVLLKGIFR